VGVGGTVLVSGRTAYGADRRNSSLIVICVGLMWSRRQRRISLKRSSRMAWLWREHTYWGEG
jgi:hypothetical protein